MGRSFAKWRSRSSAFFYFSSRGKAPRSSLYAQQLENIHVIYPLKHGWKYNHRIPPRIALQGLEAGMSLRMTSQVETKKRWLERLGEAAGCTGCNALAVESSGPRIQAWSHATLFWFLAPLVCSREVLGSRRCCGCWSARSSRLHKPNGIQRTSGHAKSIQASSGEVVLVGLHCGK